MVPGGPVVASPRFHIEFAYMRCNPPFVKSNWMSGISICVLLFTNWVLFLITQNKLLNTGFGGGRFPAEVVLTEAILKGNYF